MSDVNPYTEGSNSKNSSGYRGTSERNGFSVRFKEVRWDEAFP